MGSSGACWAQIKIRIATCPRTPGTRSRFAAPRSSCRCGIYGFRDREFAERGSGDGNRSVLAGLLPSAPAQNAQGGGCAPLFAPLSPPAQAVARSLGDITGAKIFGPDRETRAEISAELLKELHQYRSGIDPRVESHVAVMRGPREDFRRHLNVLGIAYVIAHELGHVVAHLYIEQFFGTGSVSLRAKPTSPHSTHRSSVHPERRRGDRKYVLRRSRRPDRVSHPRQSSPLSQRHDLDVGDRADARYRLRPAEHQTLDDAHVGEDRFDEADPSCVINW